MQESEQTPSVHISLDEVSAISSHLEDRVELVRVMIQTVLEKGESGFGFKALRNKLFEKKEGAITSEFKKKFHYSNPEKVKNLTNEWAQLVLDKIHDKRNSKIEIWFDSLPFAFLRTFDRKVSFEKNILNLYESLRLIPIVVDEDRGDQNPTIEAEAA